MSELDVSKIPEILAELELQTVTAQKSQDLVNHLIKENISLHSRNEILIKKLNEFLSGKSEKKTEQQEEQKSEEASSSESLSDLEVAPETDEEKEIARARSLTDIDPHD